jgi:RNA polymerase sigma-70 factor, ECF subfamily
VVNTLPDQTQPDPADRAAEVEQVSLALLVVLERLTPEQRVAFVLHDVFAVPFDEIAAALDTTTEAARQLASRGRRAVAEGGAPRHTAGLDEQRRVLAAFFAAAERGDLLELAHMLAPDVVAVGDGGGVTPAGTHPVTGVDRVARFVAGIFRQGERWRMASEPVLVNGSLGLLVAATVPGGTRFRAVLWVAIADGRVTAIYNQSNPEKLTLVQEPDPAHADWPPKF